MITERINRNLKALFDTDNDPIYKSLICDGDGVIPGTISKPTDIDIGAIASQIEYLRLLSIDLVKQIYLDQSEAEFLVYQLETFFSSLRLEDETDADWINRTIAIVFNQKVSRASIIFTLRPYSTQEPIVSTVSAESAFSDFSYANIYIEYTAVDTFVFPALAEAFDSAFFVIQVTLYETTASEILIVINILNKIIAAGITYILEIIVTVPADGMTTELLEVMTTENAEIMNFEGYSVITITGGP